MSLFADQSREQLRATWREAWRKCRARLPLQPLEAQIADVIGEHPEYHAMLEGGSVGDNEIVGENPFLHLGLHLALREQIATDRPAGIAQLHRRLSARMPQPHAAEHRMMEVLRMMLAEAQRGGAPPSDAAYLERLRRL